MKTLRDLLLDRHRSQGPALDRLRAAAVQPLRPPPWPIVVFETLFVEARRAWAVLVVLWVLIGVIHHATPPAATSRSEAQAEWLRWQEARLAWESEMEAPAKSPL